MKTPTILLSMFVMAAGAAEASTFQGRGGSNSNVTQVSRHSDQREGLAFGGVEIRIIRDWFSKKSNMNGLPPGLAKRENLPPGLARQLRRNGSLPPGLQKKIQPLPRELEVQLPRLPDGRRRVFISGSIILLDQQRNLILDIVADVL